MAKAGFDKRLWIGIGISAVLLVMLFRQIDGRQVLAAFRSMDYRYLVPSIILTFVSYYCRAIRWRYLLLPQKATSLASLFPATIVGYMANNLLPARLGEFVRAYVLAEKERLDPSSVFATLVLDRLFDGFTVLLILVLTLFTVRLPEGMEPVQEGLKLGGYVTLALYVGVIVFLVLLKRRTHWTLDLLGRLLRPFPARVAEKIIPLLGSFIAGIRMSSRPAELAALFVSSLVIWSTAIWPVDLVLRSFGISLPVTASMLIMVFLVFAVMVPASPGYVGTYHAACVYGLLAFNVQREMALSVALVMHGINFFPVILVGFYYLWRDNISLRNVEEQSAKHTG
ncbi:lysylphosphatidylglycerol synthase transmembrane domain-containing protein [Geomobilimonas luticola]|uniref:Flippase-like domain-containing protein n=1 Tax=Geomobilimonas luticola TaxID=1114878 RepID=A0ABS5SCU9_9BACT|nr:lysylphosphatidylglycerol synthase transmembrane domain-containing protein [Geomobilimonas luticola]MBT0653000.1 flippase-like domain-containing protein [Geomobilimonas luticola]